MLCPRPESTLCFFNFLSFSTPSLPTDMPSRHTKHILVKYNGTGVWAGQNSTSSRGEMPICHLPPAPGAPCPGALSPPLVDPWLIQTLRWAWYGVLLNVFQQKCLQPNRTHYITAQVSFPWPTLHCKWMLQPTHFPISTMCSWPYLYGLLLLVDSDNQFPFSPHSFCGAMSAHMESPKTWVDWKSPALEATINI